MELETLLLKATHRNASDILITSGSPPAIRIAGVLRKLKTDALDAEASRTLVYDMLLPDQIARFEETRELDFSITYKGHRFRGNAYWHGGTVAACLRLIPDQIPTPEDLGLPPTVLDMAEKPHGLILITGATGQGKSTTMASVISQINRTHRRHIVTVEDPVEFVHVNDRSIVDQREVGLDTRGFSSALRHVLRQDPDIILVGEMRDLETIQAALTAAETGHLVISTLHTNDATQAIDRIIDVFPDHQQGQIKAQLSMCLIGVIAQRLVKTVTGELTLACEILRNVPAIAHLIREGRTQLLYSTMELNQRDGMITMNKALDELVSKGVVGEDDAERYYTRGSSRDGD